MSRYFSAWLDHFPDVLTPGQITLDIGCGRGDDARTLLDAGLHVVAFDLRFANIRNVVINAPEASVVVADLRTGLPFRDQSFGLAIASLSLRYFDRATTDRILRDIHRVLTPGATLLARVNVVGDVDSLWGVGTEHEPDYFEVAPGHFKRFFTEPTFREALAPYFDITNLFPMAILVDNCHPKQTIVARATRRDA